MKAYDIIGDVHGQSAKLEALLLDMGYTPSGVSFKAPPQRQVVFLGDLIDRGPGQVRVLEIVRAMVESGEALCILGNHEINAIGYVTRSPWVPNDYLRPRTEKNRLHPDGHPKLLHLWPPKLPQAGRPDYGVQGCCLGGLFRLISPYSWFKNQRVPILPFALSLP